MKSSFKILEYIFAVESTMKVENVTFPCKIALSKANLKINRMESEKQTYPKKKKRVLPVTTLIF